MRLHPFRFGFTLLDLLAALLIMSILSAISVPRVSAFLDAIRVRGASRDAFAMFSAARHLAIAHGSQATVDIDTARSIIAVKIGTDTVRKRELALIHDVKLSASRTSITYSATGMGFGAGNLTLVIRRHNSIDSLFVSRLGRVRH